jgi:hypothetical protein
VQENIYNVIDFISDSVQSGLLPLKGEMSLSDKTNEIQRLYKSYSKPVATGLSEEH